MSGVHVDDEVLDELRIIMGDEFANLLHQFVRDSIKQVRQIADALQAGDANGLRRAAHSLKGSCGNLGLPVMAQYCSDLEEAGRAERLQGLLGTVQLLEQERKMVSSLLMARV